ncbi:Endopolyphosphatase [Podochytrium sp. JEL0797]|nr:Endopolyphosphatase [Podochytrium sp. JEL0797]
MTTTQFLHLTDIHMDPLFTASSAPHASCHHATFWIQKPLPVFGMPAATCDAPPTLVNATFKSLSASTAFNLTDIEFVLWTGDASRHDRDPKLEKTQKESRDSNRMVVKLFADTIPQGVPVIPTIGNWEVFPKSNLGCYENDPQLLDIWESWEPLFRGVSDEETDRARKTFLRGGYFERDILDGRVSVLSMNTLSFFVENKLVEDCAAFGLPRSGKRPFDPKNVADAQLDFMEEYLLQARKEGRKVILQGHVAPMGKVDDQLWKEECFEWYVYLSGEYTDVILGHYFGHTNRDMIHVISKHRDDKNRGKKHNPYTIDALLPSVIENFDLKNNEIVEVLFTGSSILPKFNPGYRVGVLQIGAQNKSISLLNHWTMYLDLHRANANAQQDRNSPLEFAPSCNTLVDYGMPDLSMKSVEEWMRVMQGKNGKKEGAKMLEMYNRCMQTSLGVDHWENGVPVDGKYPIEWVVNREVASDWMGAVVGVLVFAFVIVSVRLIACARRAKGSADEMRQLL